VTVVDLLLAVAFAFAFVWVLQLIWFSDRFIEEVVRHDTTDFDRWEQEMSR
jgi:hypothetical protein